MDKPTVYIETSIISNLTSRPSVHVRTLALQQATRFWWRHERPKYRLFTSNLVIEEIKRGNEEASRRRMVAIQDLAILEITPDMIPLANLLVKKHLLPPKAMEDAIHIAIGGYYAIDYLLT